MNYIELINNFWSHTEEEDLTSGDTSVYFALLKYNNSLNWISSFRCDYAVICQYARVSKNTFYRSLDRLQDLGLINYQKGERNKLKPKITVLKLKNKKGIIKEQEGNKEGINEEQKEEQKGNLYKPINLKTIKPINLKTKPKKTEKVFSEEVLNCFNNCLVFFSENLHPKKNESWLDAIDKLNRIDKYSFSEIENLVKKIRNDDWWSKNFQSIVKLRNKNKEGIIYHNYFTEKFKKSNNTVNSKTQLPTRTFHTNR